MSQPFLAEVRIFAFDYPPLHWALCDGAAIPIQQNSALFSLLGVNYGGDGRTFFLLPNMVAKFPAAWCNSGGSGLSERVVGETGGTATVTLLTSEIPAHPHQLIGDTTQAAVQSPTNAALGLSAAKPYHPGPIDTALAATQVTGGSLPHNNQPPYLVVNFCIAVSGLFPARQ